MPEARALCRPCHERGRFATVEIIFDERFTVFRAVCPEHGAFIALTVQDGGQLEVSNAVVLKAPEPVAVPRCPYCASSKSSNLRQLFARALTFCVDCQRWGRWT